MGNKPLKIGLKVDQTECTAGELVSGTVYLSVGKNFKFLHDVRGIHLLLKGWETTEVSLDMHEKRRREQQRGFRMSHKQLTNELQQPWTERSTHPLVNSDFPLVQDLRGTLRAGGQYEYPFQLPLPAELPGSMSCSHTDARSSCRVQYTLTAYLTSNDRDLARAAALEDRHTVVDLNLKAAPTVALTPPRPLLMDTELFPIHYCCVIHKGHLALGWQADRCQAGPDQQVSLRMWGQNNSAIDVDHISVKWVETTTWFSMSNGRSERVTRKSSRTLAEQRVSVREQSAWRSILPMHKGRRNNGISEMNNAVSTTTLLIPPDAKESYQGKFVQVRHMLVVTAQTTGWASSSAEAACQVHVGQVAQSARTSLGEAPSPLASQPSTASSTNIVVQAADVISPSAPPASAGSVQDEESHISHNGYHAPTLSAVPVAQAVPDNWNPDHTAEVVTLPMASAVLIDEPTSAPWQPSAPDESLLYEQDLEATRTMSSPIASPRAPSVPMMVNQLRHLVTDCPQNLEALLQGDDASSWRAVVQNLSPRDYCQVIQAVESSDCSSSSTSNTIHVARALAVAMGSRFEVKYILACLWTLPTMGGTDESTARIALVEALAPLAHDWTQRRVQVEEELTLPETERLRSIV